MLLEEETMDAVEADAPLEVWLGGTGIRYCGICPPRWYPIKVSLEGNDPGIFGAENLSFESLTGNKGCSSCAFDGGGTTMGW